LIDDWVVDNLQDPVWLNEMSVRYYKYIKMSNLRNLHLLTKFFCIYTMQNINSELTINSENEICNVMAIYFYPIETDYSPV